MKKSFLKLFSAMLLIVAFFFANNAFAQVPANTFGIYVGLDNDGMHSGFSYTLSNSIELGLGVIFKSESVSSDIKGFKAPDAETHVGFDLTGLYYFSKGDVNPYVELEIGYLQYPKDEDEGDIKSNDLGFGLSLGANAFIVKSFALYGSLGLYYNMYTMNHPKYSITQNTLNLLTASLGFSYYFTK